MPSFRATLLDLYLRSTMKPKPLHEIDPVELRDWFEKRAVMLTPKGVDLEVVADAPVKGEWHRLPGGANRTILYLHGGGYVFGSPRLYRTMTYPWALQAEAEVFAPVYRLAPEHPCPAAVEDAVAAFEWLVSGGEKPETIVIAGDSAGGGLALATMMALRDAGKPLPAGAVLFSPWTDLACTGPSQAANGRTDAMFKRETVANGGARYAGTLDLKDPRVSPFYGDFVGLPPMLVFASRSELLFDDSARLVPKAKAAGVPMRLEARDGLPHVWPMFHALIPEAKESIRIAADFVRERTPA
jgi:acetyl esterase/lipase